MAQDAATKNPEGQAPEGTPESNEPGQEPASTPETKPDEGKDEGKTFDAEYVKQLRSENAARRKREDELSERIQELEDRDKSEAEKAQSKLSRAEKRAAEAEAKLLRFEVAADKQVPPDAIDLLAGTTREELEAQADKILALAKQAQQAPEFDGGAREPAPEPDTPEESHRKTLATLFGINPNP